ncbi:MAG: acyl carrier protein [Clostridium sp.]
MEKKLIEKIFNILNENIDELTSNIDSLDQSLDELGMDSITFIKIIVALEEEFDLEIPDKFLLISEMNTPYKIYNILKSID